MLPVFSYNDRANLAIGKTPEAAVALAVDHFLDLAKKAINEHGAFHVALSGGSTPKAIFEKFTPDQLDWSKVHLYWGDERAVPPEDPESNYRMAMEAAFNRLPVLKENIHRMVAEKDIEEEAGAYQEILKKYLPHGKFDLIMLGMGDDGHTASLFPETHALTDRREWVTANYIPQKNCWRMTLTYPCINQAKAIVVYVIGKGKAEKVAEVIDGKLNPIELPIQGVGSPSHKPLWIMDAAAASHLDVNSNGNGRK